MFSYGFYNSLNGDRKYNAEQFNVLISNLINDGVLDNWGGMLMTECGGGLQINVKSGRAWFNDTWNENDATLPLTLDVSDPLLDRIDIVVLEVNKSLNVRANSIFIVKGTPSLTPSSPTLIDTDEIHQHALASITVRANTTEILPTDITIHVGTESCPFVTGILETASIEQLFAAWGYQFDTWFDDLKDKLSGDVAANLQHEIEELQDGKVNISDKASSTDITQGTSGKWIDAEGLAAIGYLTEDALPKYDYQEKAYSKNGSYTWECPNNIVDGIIDLIIICGAGGGGGGAGNASTGSVAFKGHPGLPGNIIIKKSISVIPGTIYKLVVGKGGAGGEYTNTRSTGSAGGASSAFDISASGGVGGEHGGYLQANGLSGNPGSKMTGSNIGYGGINNSGKGGNGAETGVGSAGSDGLILFYYRTLKADEN